MTMTPMILSAVLPTTANYHVGNRVMYNGSIPDLRNECAYVVAVCDGRYTLAFDTGDIADRVRATSISHVSVFEHDRITANAIAAAVRYAGRQ
jgi:hypothetical protein